MDWNEDGYFHVSSADGSTCGQLRVKLRASLASFCLSPDRSRDEPASRAREVEMPSLPGWPVVSTDESLALEQVPMVEEHLHQEHLHEEEDEELSLLREGGELPSNQLLARMREELALEPVAVTDLALESDESCELGRSTEVLEPKALSFDHVKIEGFSSISEAATPQRAQALPDQWHFESQSASLKGFSKLVSSIKPLRDGQTVYHIPLVHNLAC